MTVINRKQEPMFSLAKSAMQDFQFDVRRPASYDTGGANLTAIDAA
jgi:hypothetical protein